MASKKRNPRVDLASQVPTENAAKYTVDTSTPPESSPGRFASHASPMAKKMAREEVVDQRSTRIKDEARRAAAAEANTQVVDKVLGTRSEAAVVAESASKVVKSSTRRMSAKEKAQREATQAKRNAKAAAETSVSDVERAKQTSKAEKFLGSKVTNVRNKRPDEPVTKVEETLALLGHTNVEGAGKGAGSPARKSPYGRPAKTFVSTKEIDDIKSKASRAKTTVTRAKHLDRARILTERVEKDKKNLIASGLAVSETTKQEAREEHRELRSRGIAAPKPNDERRTSGDPGLGGRTATQIRAIEQGMAADQMLRHSMQPDIKGNDPTTTSTSIRNNSGTLGGLRLNTREDTEIPRVRPTLVNTEHEVRRINPKTGLQREGVAARYGAQQDRRHKINSIIEQNKAAETAQWLLSSGRVASGKASEEEIEATKHVASRIQPVPPPLSGRTDKAPEFWEILPEGYSQEKAMIPAASRIQTGKNGETKVTEVPKGTLHKTDVASGSDVVETKLPAGWRVHSLSNEQLGETIQNSGSYGSEAARQMLVSRQSSPYLREMNEATRVKKAGPKPAGPNPLPVPPTPEEFVAEKRKRNRQDLIGIDLHKIATNQPIRGADKSLTHKELKEGYENNPALRGSVMKALQKAGFRAGYGYEYHTGSNEGNETLRKNAEMVFSSMGSMSGTGVPEQVLGNRPKPGSNTAPLQRRGQYVAEGQYAKKPKGA